MWCTCAHCGAEFYTDGELNHISWNLTRNRTGDTRPSLDDEGHKYARELSLWFCDEDCYIAYYNERDREEAQAEAERQARQEEAEQARQLAEEQARIAEKAAEEHKHQQMLANCVLDGNVYYSADKKILQEFYDPTLTAGEFVVPDGVEIISHGAFTGTHFTSIRLPDSVTIIGDYAFSTNEFIPSGCEELTSVVMSKNCIKIGERAFTALRTACACPGSP
ncbi:MAG: leucine-rich repeat protein, partial [Treponema sp.]|nr:leucine-rich repeat protein [Treponema sp.]